jgi:hypothetical protein
MWRHVQYIGWVVFYVFTFSTKIPFRFVLNTENSNKNCLTQWPVFVGHDFLDLPLLEGQEIFVPNMGLMDIKDVKC